MRRTPIPEPRLAPLFEGGACGSLGARDVAEIGIDIVAIDVLELDVEVGCDRVREAGGINRWLSWPGPVLAVFRIGTAAAQTTGWRGRGRPQLMRERDGALTLKSAIDGSMLKTSGAELAAAARSIGAVPTFALDDAGPQVVVWDNADISPPAVDMVVSALAATQASAGQRLYGGAWSEVDSEIDINCDCRACSIASPALLRHLWRSREITATHLLTWHNLHRMRLGVETG